MIQPAALNILVYFPYNQRSVEQQSVMEMLVQKGHHVFLLTLTGEGFLHDYVRRIGVKVYTSPAEGNIKFKNIYQNARQLVKFCKLHDIDVIIAHQQLAALPLIFAHPFLNVKSFYVRHNADEDYAAHPFKAWIMNRFINKTSQNIIAPSNMVFQYLVQKEKVPVKKISQINYGYNFSQYEKADKLKAIEIRNKYPCRLLIISIARLVPAKRHQLMFKAVEELVAAGFDIKMICLGGGKIMADMESQLLNKKLEKFIFLLGIQPNVFDYLEAADILLHLSETEASNSVVKEAGLAKRAAIVCENVGDFNDYISNEKNGFLVNKQNPVPSAIAALQKCYADKNFLKELGDAFCKTVIQHFDIKNVTSHYEDILR